MGNCLCTGDKKKKRKASKDSYGLSSGNVTGWVTHSDFSIVPEESETNASAEKNEVTPEVETWTAGVRPVVIDLRQVTPRREVVERMEPVVDEAGGGDGYQTAAEDLQSEEEEKPMDTARSEDLESLSAYLTSDEREDEQIHPAEDDCMRTPVRRDFASDEDDDVVEELNEKKKWINNYDARPIRSLPSPVVKNMISPSVRLEDMCTKDGKLRRNHKVQEYLDGKRSMNSTCISADICG